METPITVLDPTGEAWIYEKLLRRTVITQQQPEGNNPLPEQFFAQRDFSKSGLKWTSGLQTAISTCRNVLSQMNSRDEMRAAKTIGLIWFKENVDQLGDALEIAPERRGHFWEALEVDRWRGCDRLLVIGTPRVDPDDLRRLACVVHWGEADPIRMDVQEGSPHFKDARVEFPAELVTRGEVTRCANAIGTATHPVCVAVIGGVPAAQMATAVLTMPQLADDGRAGQTAN